MAASSHPRSPTPSNDSTSTLTHTPSIDSTSYPKSTTERLSSSFFSIDPSARTIFLKTFIPGAFLVVLVIFAVLSIYWGALWKSPARNLHGWIVDFDNEFIGETVTHALAGSPQGRITWTVVPAANFPNGISDLQNAVVEEESWVAIAINEGATARLNSAVATVNASYDGTAAVTVFAVEARNENAYRSLIKPSVEQALQLAAHQFSLKFSTSLSASRNTTAALLSIAPQILIQPFYYTISNLRPFDIPVASAVTFIGLIYLLVLSFFIVVINHSAREAARLNSTLTIPALIRMRLSTAFLTYFFISLSYSLLSVAFHLPLSRNFGHGGFPLFWLLNWIGMLAVGLPLDSLITLLTPRFIPFFMILWIITNVSVCILPISVLPRIYAYGYAVPFYNVSRAVRTIVFGTKNTLGLNFGVLLAWVAVGSIVLGLVQWFVSGREVRKLRREVDGKVGV